MQNTTQADIAIIFKTTARVAPTGAIISLPQHFSLTLSGANNVCTALAFSNSGIFGGLLTATDTANVYTANSSTIFQSQSPAAYIWFTGAELNGTAI
jgi:hypothetical protein